MRATFLLLHLLLAFSMAFEFKVKEVVIHSLTVQKKDPHYRDYFEQKAEPSLYVQNIENSQILGYRKYWYENRYLVMVVENGFYGDNIPLNPCQVHFQIDKVSYFDFEQKKSDRYTIDCSQDVSKETLTLPVHRYSNAQNEEVNLKYSVHNSNMQVDHYFRVISGSDFTGLNFGSNSDGGFWNLTLPVSAATDFTLDTIVVPCFKNYNSGKLQFYDSQREPQKINVCSLDDEATFQRGTASFAGYPYFPNEDDPYLVRAAKGEYRHQDATLRGIPDFTVEFSKLEAKNNKTLQVTQDFEGSFFEWEPEEVLEAPIFLMKDTLESGDCKIWIEAEASQTRELIPCSSDQVGTGPIELETESFIARFSIFNLEPQLTRTFSMNLSNSEAYSGVPNISDLPRKSIVSAPLYRYLTLPHPEGDNITLTCFVYDSNCTQQVEFYDNNGFLFSSSQITLRENYVADPVVDMPQSGDKRLEVVFEEKHKPEDNPVAYFMFKAPHYKYLHANNVTFDVNMNGKGRIMTKLFEGNFSSQAYWCSQVNVTITLPSGVWKNSYDCLKKDHTYLPSNYEIEKAWGQNSSFAVGQRTPGATWEPKSSDDEQGIENQNQESYPPDEIPEVPEKPTTPLDPTSPSPPVSPAGPATPADVAPPADTAPTSFWDKILALTPFKARPDCSPWEGFIWNLVVALPSAFGWDHDGLTTWLKTILLNERCL